MEGNHQAETYAIPNDTVKPLSFLFSTVLIHTSEVIPMPGKNTIDKTDVLILTKLREDASLSATELSKIVHLSIPSINKRIANMVASGLIERYTLAINPEKAGKPVRALISILLSSPEYITKFLELVSSEENITACYAVTGEYDYMLEMYAPTILELNQQILAIKDSPGVAKTLTTIVLDTYKRETCILPEAQK